MDTFNHDIYGAYDTYITCLFKILKTCLRITLKVCLPRMVERNLDNAVRKQSRRPSSPDDLPEGKKKF
jgi:hypothetical protein